MNKLIEKEITEAAQKGDFSGVIDIAEGGGSVYSRAFGFADIANKRPNNAETKFGIASGTKLFTALAVGRLIDKGAISLSDRALELAGHGFPRYSKDITIEHLLTHTSGMPDYYDDELVDGSGSFKVAVPWCELREPRDYLAVFPDKGMIFAPGGKFLYSNGGFILLAHIVAEISGRRYADFVEAEILTPCGMTSSGFYPFDGLPENTAYGYIRKDGALRTNIYDLPIVGAGDGGMYSTAADISKLWKCLMGCEILSENLTREFLVPRVKAEGEGESAYYGLGIWIKKTPQGMRHYITGFDPGGVFQFGDIPGQKYHCHHSFQYIERRMAYCKAFTKAFRGLERSAPSAVYKKHLPVHIAGGSGRQKYCDTHKLFRPAPAL